MLAYPTLFFSLVHLLLLHSFPTRRSSDLRSRCSFCHRFTLSEWAWRSSPAKRGVHTETPPISTRSPRSEEHTSELQSPCNLVCRLLLEQKTHKTPEVQSFQRSSQHTPQPS